MGDLIGGEREGHCWLYDQGRGHGQGQEQGPERQEEGVGENIIVMRDDLCFREGLEGGCAVCLIGID